MLYENKMLGDKKEEMVLRYSQQKYYVKKKLDVPSAWHHS